MTVQLDLPPHVEQAYLEEARARGVPLDDLVREVLIARRPANHILNKSAHETVFERGLGSFRNPADAALLYDVVSIAYEERRRPTKRTI